MPVWRIKRHQSLNINIHIICIIYWKRYLYILRQNGLTWWFSFLEFLLVFLDWFQFQQWNCFLIIDIFFNKELDQRQNLYNAHSQLCLHKLTQQINTLQLRVIDLNQIGRWIHPNNSAEWIKFLCTCVPLSPISTIWYWPSSSDALQLWR